MTQIKKLGFTSLALAAAVWQTYADTAGGSFQWFWQDKVSQGISWTTQTDGVDSTIQVVVWNIMMYIWIIAVLYGIYGGFLILTAGWKEDWVKKWKTIIFQSAFWIIVIFLANSIVQWLLGAVLKTWA